MEYRNETSVEKVEEIVDNLCQRMVNLFVCNRFALYVVAYCLVFLFGVMGNFAVVYVVCTVHRMQSTTNILIANLASADLLVIVFCLPLQLYNNLYDEWKFGEILCKLVSYLQGVSVCASMNILMAISVERCITICYPMFRPFESQNRKNFIVGIWLVPLVLPLPWLFFFHIEQLEDDINIQVCVESWPNVDIGNMYYITANLLLCYLLPLLVISVCFYCIWRRVSGRTVPGESIDRCNELVRRSKMKVTKMMLIVISIFLGSWLPLYTIFTVIKFSEGSASLQSCIPFAQWLGVSNSCINPLLYAFYNRTFRESFKTLMPAGFCTAIASFNSNSSSRTRTDVLSQEVHWATSGIVVKVGKGNRTIRRTASSQLPAMKKNSLRKDHLLRGRSLDCG